MQNTQWQVLAYIGVGVINTLFGYSLYALFLYLGLHYAVAAFFSTCLGILFNFKTTGVIVFKNKNNQLLFKFIGVYGFLYCLSIGIIKLLQPFANNYIAGFFATLCCAAVGFCLNKFLVFKHEPKCISA